MSSERSESRVQTYAAAFYEAAFERWVAALEGAAQGIAGDSRLAGQLASTDLPWEERQTLLDALVPAGTDQAVRNLLYTMMERGDLALAGDVATGLKQLVRRAESGPTPVEVVTAVEMSAQQRRTLESKLAQEYGPALSFAYRVDPAILGGVVVRVGDKLIDGSVASRLAAMKQSLGVSDKD
jgi:F-type H+-transporting ATPase subunit delta